MFTTATNKENSKQKPGSHSFLSEHRQSSAVRRLYSGVRVDMVGGLLPT